MTKYVTKTELHKFYDKSFTSLKLKLSQKKNERGKLKNVVTYTHSSVQQSDVQLYGGDSCCTTMGLYGKHECTTCKADSNNEKV